MMLIGLFFSFVVSQETPYDVKQVGSLNLRVEKRLRTSEGGTEVHGDT